VKEKNDMKTQKKIKIMTIVNGGCAETYCNVPAEYILIDHDNLGDRDFNCDLAFQLKWRKVENLSDKGMKATIDEAIEEYSEED
jgi:hypothetical protein